METSANLFAPIKEQIEKGRGQDTPIIVVDDSPVRCPICKDLGWVVLDVPPWHEDFGKAFDCSCQAEKLKQKRWDRCGIPKDKRGETFDTFRKRKGTEEELEAAQALRDGRVQLVILTGNCGSGKTHLAHAVVIHALEMGGTAMIIRAADWLDDLKSAIKQDIASKDNSNPTTSADIMRNAANRIPVLAIDELKYRTNFDEETIDNLITRRINAGLRTIITSNFGPDDLRKVFPRVVSRSEDPRYGRCVWTTATDYRHELAEKAKRGDRRGGQ
ncbi:MAG: ATP-binding protein [Dehalococcoidia bacterium]|nr:ATP-binding protein [Dehalococcoidia bacterium]